MRILTVSAFVLLTILAMSPAVLAGEVVTVTVKGQASLNSATITIGDIADIAANDSALAANVSSVRLGVSPMPGSWRELDRDMIRTQLTRSGFDPTRAKLVCPSIVRIYRQSQVVSQQMMEMRLRDFIATNAPWAPDEMEVSDISQVGQVVLPAGNLGIDIQPRGNGTYTGSMPFTISFSIDGQVVQQIVMQARIAVFQEVAVAKVSIATRHMISETDVELRRIDISQARGQAFGDINEVIGKAAATYINPGQVITARNITMPLLVKRGDTVILMAKRPGFEIRTSGIAQQDGKLGEMIRVLNSSSRKIVDARVAGAQTAEVMF